MTLQEQEALDSRYIMHTFGRKPVEFVEGRGMYLTDSEGKKYLDFLSGIGVCSLGHCPEAVVDAITQQAAKLIHVSNYFYIEHRGQVAKRLSELLNTGRSNAPDWKTFFANSGAEANECAIKLARLSAKRRLQEAMPDATEAEIAAQAPTLIVTLVKSFHGRTLATLAATGQRVFHKGFEPIPEGFLPIPINDCEALEDIFQRVGKSICAVMIEPIQGESGVHVCTEEFLKTARRLTEKHDALLIFDEVQCGIYRTGKPFAFQNYAVVPDVVTMAKGIASGMVAGACAAAGPLGDVLQPGQHGTTFGGSNLAMAAAEATLAGLSASGFAKGILEAGEYLQEQLMQLKEVMEVRGIGLMVGVDLIDGYNAPDIVTKALECGLVINSTGPHTLRFLPPLICTKADVDEFMERLRKALG